MLSDQLKSAEQSQASKEDKNIQPRYDKKDQQNLRTEIDNYSTLISSSPRPTQEQIKNQLSRVADAMKQSLGLPSDASITLKRSIHNNQELVTGMISIPGTPKNVSMSVGIDSDDGSIVIGKPYGGEATISGFNLGVRLSGSSMKDDFEKISNALKILPEGFSAVGLNDKGDVVAYNGQSNGMLSLGSKNLYLENVRVVSFDERGRPVVKKPTELRVEQSNEEGSTPRLRIGINEEVSFVDPFPATINKQSTAINKLADKLNELLKDNLNSGGKIIGGGVINP